MQKTSSLDAAGEESGTATLFNTRLESLMGSEALATWAEKHGLNPQSLYNIKGKLPGLKLLLQIQAATGCSLDWLLGISSQNQEAKGAQEDEIRIPIYDVHASAGHGTFAPDTADVDYYMPIRRHFIEKELGLTVKGLYGIKIKGVSMEPLLHNGRPALVNSHDTELSEPGIYFIRLEGGLMVKNLQRLPGGRLRIWSENQQMSVYQPIEMSWPPHESVDFKVFGRILWSDRVF